MTTPPKRAKRGAANDDASTARAKATDATAATETTVTTNTARGRKTRPLDAITDAPPDALVEAATDVPATPAVPAPADAIETAAPAPSAPADARSAPATVELPAVERDEFADEVPDELADEIPDESDEWSVADQPTVVMSPQAFKRKRPAYLETDEHPSWPPSARHGTLGDVTPPIGLRGQQITSARPSGLNGPQLAAPDGRKAPTSPPPGVARAAMSNPRMHRFQELRRQRIAHEDGAPAPEDATPVTDRVRQWWSDLLPGLANGLHYQRAARASGLHPIPAHMPAAMTKLGDAFGYLAVSARDAAERAGNAAGPRLKQLHDRAERAAQALIQRFEGSEVRQQGPLLGPGRIAVFFRPAVTVGQAQRLLAATQARPMRIIPRKHGFLAWVKPGTEAQISERLRKHPYVHDVVYLDYDEYGDPVDPNETQAEG